MLVLLVLMIQY